MKRKYGRALLILIVFVLASLAAPAAATFPGSNGLIAFATRPIASPPVYYQRVFTNGGGQLAKGVDPSWSADGSEIAFARGDIFLMASDGSDHRRVTNDCDFYFSQPAWSPDGTKIAYVKTGDAYRTIEVLDLRTGTVTTSSTWTRAASPDWSPDGSQLAFAENGAIYTSDPQGGTLVQVTTPPSNAIDQSPSWSPDGSRLAFSSSRSETSQIWAVSADGSDLRQVTFGSDEEPPGVSTPQRFGPVWSPDGTKLAYVETDGPHDYRSYIANADGTNPTRGPGGPESIDWQPIDTTAPAPVAVPGLPKPHCTTELRFTATLTKEPRQLNGHVGSESALCRRHHNVEIFEEKQGRGGRWHDIATTVANRRGNFHFGLPDRVGSYRVFTSNYIMAEVGGRKRKVCNSTNSNVVTMRRHLR